MKVIVLMKIINDDSPSYEKLIKELRKVYDRGKGVNPLASTIN